MRKAAIWRTLVEEELGDQAVESVDVQMTQGQSVTVDKYVIVMDSRSMPNEQLQRQVEQALNHFAAYGLEQELADHIQAYDSLWERMDMEVEVIRTRN